MKSVEKPTGFTGMLDKLTIPIAVIIAIYHVANAFTVLQGSTNHYITHLSSLVIFSLLVLFIQRKGTTKWIALVLLLFTVVSMSYIWMNSARLEKNIGFCPPTDFFIGILLCIAIIGATWLSWGAALPILTILFAMYFFFGDLLPGPLYHAPLPAEFVMSHLGMGISVGILGYLIPTSANYVFLFMLLAGLFGVTRVLPMFFEVGKWVGNILQGGPAFVAVIASTMFGMISGAAMANVLFTGSFTIPAMKSQGFRPEQAGAIEAAASTGGQIMPPIMGAAAFVMATFLGVPYFDIMMRAFMPAFLYYGLVFFGVYLICRRDNIVAPKDPVNWRLVRRVLPVFGVPLVILVVLLGMNYSAMMGASWAVVALVLMACTTKFTRPSLKELMAGIKDGVIMAASCAALLGAVGIIAQAVITTGLGPKLSAAFMGLAGSNVLAILVLSMILSIILGVGVPTTAAYIMVVLVSVPLLINLGVTPFAAHFFAFYFAVFSTLTPPVALASIAASKLAGSDWIKTSLEGLRLALSAWIIPYVFVYVPELMQFPNIGIKGIIAFVFMIFAGAVAAMTVYAYSTARMNLFEIVLGTVSFFSFFTYYITKNMLLAVPAFACFALVVALPLVRKRAKARLIATGGEAQ